ncbi:MAG: hypothetical protein U9R54_03690 [Bacteroidota bacterium]|nr:hypothetical protein [Bacteroidota bacterium]
MRKILTAFLLFCTLSLFAQENDDDFFFHDISFDYGIFASLNSSEHENLLGSKYAFQTTYYFINNTGLRSGIAFVNDIEGSDKFFSVPLQFVYRTPVDRTYRISNNIGSLEEFFFKAILGLMPRQAEFYGGINIGHIKADNSISYTSINGGPLFEEGYELKQEFFTSVNAGMRFLYKIRQLGIFLAPSVNYTLTNNFKYYSDIPENNDNYIPKWFFSGTFGLSYQF